MAGISDVPGVCWSSTSITVLLFGLTCVLGLDAKEELHADSVPNYNKPLSSEFIARDHGFFEWLRRNLA